MWTKGIVYDYIRSPYADQHAALRVAEQVEAALAVPTEEVRRCCHQPRGRVDCVVGGPRGAVGGHQHHIPISGSPASLAAAVAAAAAAAAGRS